MPQRINRGVIENYFLCQYKSYLKQTVQRGSKSDYETLLAESRGKVRLEAISKILIQHRGDQIAQDIPLTTSVLRQGLLFILEANFEDDHFSLSFDGLKKVKGPSKLGDFHYIPMLFHDGRQIRKEQRLLLELYGLLLYKLQGTVPNSGIIWHGRECKATTVRLNLDLRRSEQFLEDLRALCNSESPPKLMLNEHCQICEFQQRCHDQAVQEDNLSLLCGMSEKEIKKCSKKGILTVTQFAHTFRPRRKGKRESKTPSQHYHALQALAIRDKKIYVIGKPELPDKPVHIYLDIESDPDANFIYLIGMIVVENDSEKSYSFWADHKEQEAKIFEQFVSEVTRHENFIVFCYGSYELAYLRRMRKVAKRKRLVDKILNASINILSLIYSHIYFPTYSNGLKDIGRFLNCSWNEPNASGIQSIIWRMEWEATQCEDWKQKLTTYNLEDCAALKKVVEVVQAIIAKACSEPESPVSEQGQPPIAFVKDEKMDYPYNLGTVNFFHPDYEYINNCAYFDYQRKKVYVRTSNALKKKKSGKKKLPNKKLRVSNHVMIKASSCPTCKSRKIIGGVKREKWSKGSNVRRAFDLVLTPGGIRRKVIEVRASIHQCLNCDKKFIPPAYQRLDKHFHSLKSWAMFQHVEYSISFEAISRMFEELFSLRVLTSEIHEFKSFLARYYKTTYKKLLRKILTGNMLHIDETEMKLRKEKGYVWVFTNLEEVVFMFKPTREGGFLRDLLKGFQGVLVSDFYTTYDSVECPQQKCLIHLMRDINQELLSNPFDEELQLITRPFGTLLRTIITTIDKHGLRHKYLRKHEREVTDFFQSLSEHSFDSEAAKALQERITKYRNKLFTFINYDGVPWNNNNAEHAIKQFANYRERTTGKMTENGLSDYLVLLSICQTCHYKDVSFLKFLLSRQQDIDAFCERKHQKLRLPAIELYPKGFVPPRMINLHNRRLQREQQRDSALPQDILGVEAGR